MGQSGSKTKKNTSSSNLSSNYNNHSSTSYQAPTSTHQSTTSNNNTSSTTTTSTTKPTSKKNELEQLFDKYQQIDDHEGETGGAEDYVGGDGIMTFCTDVGIDPMDVIVLMVMYKLNCKHQYKITRKEWIDGFQSNYISNLEDMKSKIPQIKSQLNANSKTFKPFYSWCFTYLKEADQKGMSVEAACQSWPVILNGKYQHLEDWCNFMQVEINKAVQKDTWELFYDFVSQVGNDFNNYNEDGAWPVAVDEFVAWMKEGKNVAVRERLAKQRAEQQAEE